MKKFLFPHKKFLCPKWQNSQHPNCLVKMIFLSFNLPLLVHLVVIIPLSGFLKRKNSPHISLRFFLEAVFIAANCASLPLPAVDKAALLINGPGYSQASSHLPLGEMKQLAQHHLRPSAERQREQNRRLI